MKRSHGLAKKRGPLDNTAVSSSDRFRLKHGSGTEPTTKPPAKRQQTFSTRGRIGNIYTKSPRNVTTTTAEGSVTTKWGVAARKAGPTTMTRVTASQPKKSRTLSCTSSSSGMTKLIYHKQRDRRLTDVDAETDDENSWKDQVMEIPYAMNLGMGDSSADDSDGGYESPTTRSTKTRRREPLRPGDVIEYTCPVFVSGHASGHRVAVVLCTNPEHPDFPIVLDNAEVLPRDTSIKRIGEYIQGEVHAHPGVFRPLDLFLLSKSSLPGENGGALAGLRRKAKQLEEMSKRVEAEAFARLRKSEAAGQKTKTKQNDTKRGRKKKKKSDNELSFASSSGSSCSSETSSSSSNESIAFPQRTRASPKKTIDIPKKMVRNQYDSSSSSEFSIPRAAIHLEKPSNAPSRDITKRRKFLSVGSESSSSEDDNDSFAGLLESKRSTFNEKCNTLTLSKRGFRSAEIEHSNDGSAGNDSVTKLPTKSSDGWIHKKAPSKESKTPPSCSRTRPRAILRPRIPTDSVDGDESEIRRQKGRPHLTVQRESKTCPMMTKEKKRFPSSSRHCGPSSAERDGSSDRDENYGSKKIVPPGHTNSRPDTISIHSMQKIKSNETPTVPHAAARTAREILGFSPSSSSSSDDESINFNKPTIRQLSSPKHCIQLKRTKKTNSTLQEKGSFLVPQAATSSPGTVDLMSGPSEMGRKSSESRIAKSSHKSSTVFERSSTFESRHISGSIGLSLSENSDAEASVARVRGRTMYPSAKERLLLNPMVRARLREEPSLPAPEPSNTSTSLGLRKHNGRDLATSAMRPSPAFSAQGHVTGESSNKRKLPQHACGTGIQPLQLSPVYLSSAAKNMCSLQALSSRQSSMKKANKSNESRSTARQKARTQHEARSLWS
jgi:hypothetical protein